MRSVILLWVADGPGGVKSRIKVRPSIGCRILCLSLANQIDRCISYGSENVGPKLPWVTSHCKKPGECLMYGVLGSVRTARDLYCTSHKLPTVRPVNPFQFVCQWLEHSSLGFNFSTIRRVRPDFAAEKTGGAEIRA
jgi:hypothetical protein